MALRGRQRDSIYSGNTVNCLESLMCGEGVCVCKGRQEMRIES